MSIEELAAMEPVDLARKALAAAAAATDPDIMGIYLSIARNAYVRGVSEVECVRILLEPAERELVLLRAAARAERLATKGA